VSAFSRVSQQAQHSKITEIGGSIFVPEEILPDLYRIEIPLPRNPLKVLNSYLIKHRTAFSLLILE